MTKNYKYIIILIITFSILVIGYNWGLPTNKRMDLLFKNEVSFNEKLQDILKTRKKIITIKNDQLCVDDYMNYVRSLSSQDAINRAIYQFLLTPYAGDDMFILKAIKNMNPNKFEFDPKMYLYGGGFVYSSAVFLKLASLVGYINLVPNEEYYMRNINEIGKIFTVLRLMMVLIATIGIFMAYCLVSKLFGNNIALLSWFIMLSAPVTYQATHSIEPHIFALPFYVISFYYLFNSIKNNILFNYTISAIFCGLVIGIQSTSFTIIFPFFASLIINYSNSKISVKEAFKYFIMYAFISFVLFFLVNPYYLINYQEAFNQYKFGLIEDKQYYMGYLNKGPYQLSIVLCVLFVTSILYHLVFHRHKHFSQLAITGALSGIAVFIITKEAMPYVYSTIFLFSVLTSIMIIEIYKVIKYKTIKVTYLLLISLLFIVSPISRSVYYKLNFNSQIQDDAGYWVNNNISSNTQIGITYPPTTWDSFAFRFNDYRLVDFRTLDISKNEKLPDYIITVNQQLPKLISYKYKLEKTFPPKSVFGYHYEIEGELNSLIAQTINVYLLKQY